MTNATRKLKQAFSIIGGHMFDTHKYILLLMSKGIKKEQAESIVQVVSASREMDMSKFATREQVEGIKMQIENLEKRFDRFEIEIKQEMKDLRQEMKDLRQEIRVILRWVIGLVVSIIAATATVLSFVLPLLLKR